MKNSEENKKPIDKKFKKVEKVSPLGNLKEQPPTRNEKPEEEFIDEKANTSKKRS